MHEYRRGIDGMTFIEHVWEASTWVIFKDQKTSEDCELKADIPRTRARVCSVNLSDVADQVGGQFSCLEARGWKPI